MKQKLLLLTIIFTVLLFFGCEGMMPTDVGDLTNTVDSTDNSDTAADNSSTTDTTDTSGTTETADSTDADAVAADKTALTITYSGSDSAANVTGSISLSSSGSNGTTITWASSNSSVISSGGAVTRPDNGDGDASVTMTATITKNDSSDSRQFILTVLEQEAAPDTTAPAAGNGGALTTSSVSDTSFTVNWTAATDETSAQANLQYLVYYSGSNNIASVSTAESNGTAAGSYTSNISSRSVAGLTEDTQYYYNVIVKDEAGNKSAYTSGSVTTNITIPSSYTVSGYTDYGGGDANGTFTLSGTPASGERPAYTYFDGANAVSFTIEWSSSDSCWYLMNESNGDWDYKNTSDSYLPPTGGWVDFFDSSASLSLSAN